MSLINSQSIVTEGSRMSDQIAKQDIIEKNDLGQFVLVVAKGQPIPVGRVEKPAAKKVAAPAENKARRMPRGKKDAG